MDHLRTIFAGDLESRLNVVKEFVELCPVGTHAGDRTIKKTVPGAFEVPR
jgi:hypothetical protein